jgi:lysophospholipase L1-like esterase
VLLEGDSITRNYYDQVEVLLKGKANVYLFATSLGVGDPRLAGQIRDYLTGRPLDFAVIHLNNGMHGAQYTAEEFSADYPELLAPIKALAPGAKCIVATTTPVRKDLPDYPTNAEIDRRNATASAYALRFACALDDQHRLMMDHQDLHADDVHFGPEGAAIQARQVAAAIEAVLSERAK